jgi:hypothetical protein
MTDSEAIEAIKQVKYRYLRALDTRNWDEFAATLTDDIAADYGASLGKTQRFTDRASLVDYMRSSLPPSVISEHRVTHPEITLDGADTASGIWYLQDRIIAAEHDFMLFGAAFYHDGYRRTGDGWKISATGYARTYEVTMPLSSIAGFHATPGAALHR